MQLDFEVTILKKIFIVIFVFLIAVLPFIVRFHQVTLSYNVRSLWGNFINNDFFSFYKMVWLLLMSFGLIFVFLVYIIKYRLVVTYYYVPLIIYGFLLTFSTIFSEYTNIALFGFPDRYENLFVNLAYLLITIVAINIFREVKLAKLVVGALLVSAFFLSIHGLMQYFGFDFFLTSIGRVIITPSGMEIFANQYNLHHSQNDVIYSTMYNPNYVGSYGAMLVSFLLGLYINTRQKKRIYLLGILNILMFAYLVGSRSRAGMIGLFVGMFFLGLLLYQQIKKNWRQVLVIALAFLIIFFSMGAYSLEDLLSDIISPKPEDVLVEEEIIAPPITNVESEDNKLILETSENKINVILEDNEVKFLDEDGSYIIYYSYPMDTRYYLAGEDYENHSFELNLEESKISWFYYNKEANFKYNEGNFYLQGMHGEYFEIKEVPSWGFDGYERLGSSRGYIWSRTFPLLTETLLIGHGPDTYAFYYPQEDVVGKLKFLRSPRMLVDKPHNMYLQIAVNTGVLSLLVMLAFWVYYIFQSCIIYWKADYSRWETRTGIALMAAVVAYLVTGIFNDSVVSVAPVFWILLGMGISMNILLTRGKENSG